MPLASAMTHRAMSAANGMALSARRNIANLGNKLHPTELSLRNLGSEVFETIDLAEMACVYYCITFNRIINKHY